jgi:hypothetical protein
MDYFDEESICSDRQHQTCWLKFKVHVLGPSILSAALCIGKSI